MPKDEFLLPLFGEAFLFPPFLRSTPSNTTLIAPKRHRRKKLSSRIIPWLFHRSNDDAVCKVTDFSVYIFLSTQKPMIFFVASVSKDGVFRYQKNTREKSALKSKNTDAAVHLAKWTRPSRQLHT